MRRFPAEFADLLTAKGRRVLERGYEHAAERFHESRTPFAMLDGMISRDTARACMHLLDRYLYGSMRPAKVPIPPETISEMERDYQEALPKSLHFKTAYLASRRAASTQACERIGLLRMLASPTFTRFAEAVAGMPLEGPPGRQAILYEPGDHAGPHNDHHPESQHDRDGFVDVHVMFSNDAVAHHWLVYEEDGYLSRIADITGQGSIAVYRLPFWHYTTPLVAKKSRESDARRWLLLGTFHIDWEQCETE